MKCKSGADEQWFELDNDGIRFIARCGYDDAFWELVAQNRWEPQTYKVFRQFILPNSTYIDIGAWIGPTVLFGCQIADRVIAVEPDPVAYKELAANVLLNMRLCGNVELINACIASQNGTALVGTRSQVGDSKSSMLFAGAKSKWAAKSITIEQLVEEYQVTNCSLIKMDIEGGEYVVLPSMARYLKKQKPTLFVSLHPFLLGPNERSGVLTSVHRLVSRLVGFWKVLLAIRSYRYWYDDHGNPIRIEFLAERSVDSRSFSLIATDVEWTREHWGAFPQGVHSKQQGIIRFIAGKAIDRVKQWKRSPYPLQTQELAPEEF